METEVIEIDGKEHSLIDTIKDEKNTYNYFINNENPADFCILKSEITDNEEYYISLETEKEFDYALNLFQKKHQNDNF